MSVPGIIGKKLGMTQRFSADGSVVPVTVIQAGPCVVVQRKTETNDGYEAVQLGFVEGGRTRANKPLTGHFKKAEVPPLRVLKEFRLPPGEDAAVGARQALVLAIFLAGEYERARDLEHQNLEGFRRSESSFQIADSLTLLSAISWRIGDAATSWSHLLEAMRFWSGIDSAAGLARALGMAAIVQISNGDPELGARIAGAVYRLVREHGVMLAPVKVLHLPDPADLATERLGHLGESLAGLAEVGRRVLDDEAGCRPAAVEHPEEQREHDHVGEPDRAARLQQGARALDALAPDEVVLAPPRTVPKTSSGKLRRSAARALYESGTLSKKGYALWWQLTRLSVSGFGHRARRLRRRIFDLVYAGYWWALLLAGASMVWSIVLLLPSRAWRHRVIHHAARGFLRLTGLSPKVDVEEPIPARDVLLAVNHASYLDAVVLSAVIPGTLTFVDKEELAAQLVAGPFLRRIGTLFVRRTDVAGGVEDTRAMLEASRLGERIVSFPEGTLTRMPGLSGFYLGSFLVAVEAGIPVVPIVISGTRSALRGGQWFPRPSKISVHIGKAVQADGKDFSAAVRLRDAVRAKTLAFCGEPDLGPSNHPRG